MSDTTNTKTGDDWQRDIDDLRALDAGVRIRLTALEAHRSRVEAALRELCGRLSAEGATMCDYDVVAAMLGPTPAPCSASASDAEKPENHPDFCKYCGTVPCKHEREPQPSPAPAAGQKAEVARSMQDTLEKISVCGRCDTCRSMAVAVLALAADLERRERGEGQQ